MNDNALERPDEPSIRNSESTVQSTHTVRLPRFLVGEPVGLGDVVKQITRTAGFPPCAPCEERAARLNRWLRFERPDRRRDP